MSFFFFYKEVQWFRSQMRMANNLILNSQYKIKRVQKNHKIQPKVQIHFVSSKHRVYQLYVCFWDLDTYAKPLKSTWTCICNPFYFWKVEKNWTGLDKVDGISGHFISEPSQSWMWVCSGSKPHRHPVHPPEHLYVSQR